MSFPISPTNGDTTTVNGITYIYRSATRSWLRTQTPLGNINLTGNLTAGNVSVTNKLFTTEGLYWSGNGVAFSSGAGLTYTADTAPPISGNVTGDQWYNTVTDVLFEYLDNGVSQYWVDVQTSVIAANAVVTIPELIQANLGAFQLYANTKIGTNTNNYIIASNIISGGSGLFQGPYDENSVLSGVFVGNTGTGVPSPRIGFFTGDTAKNWQIDNFGGAFRWFVPGTTKMTLYDSGNLNVTGGYTVGGKQAVNGPAFRAFIASGQTIASAGAQVKVTFGSETFDTDGCFSSSRFTPTVEGYYQLNATVRISGTAGTGENMLVLYKNGGEYARGTNGSGTEIGASFYSMQVSDIVYANGTTDFFEVYIQQGSGGNRDTTAGTNISYFSGCMIRGA
jgi:hypothetical protein